MMIQKLQEGFLQGFSPVTSRKTPAEGICLSGGGVSPGVEDVSVNGETACQRRCSPGFLRGICEVFLGPISIKISLAPENMP